MVMGEDGIIAKAIAAKNKTEIAQTNESKQYEELISKYLGSNRDIDEQQLAEVINQIVDKKLAESSVSGSPVGSVISQMGKSAPDGYLKCDGTTYNISEYQKLADYIKGEFGSYNYFGGDGTQTFATPDLRGEFLRGTGTAKRNTGSGDEVGTHQDSTYIPTVIADQDRLEYISAATKNDGKGNPKNMDKPFYSSIAREYRLSELSSNWDSYSTVNSGFPSHYGIRPTNTSVLYCIKY